MNGKQIESEVIRYLGDNNYRYAILIEGEWGCGKTYFVLNDLQTAIEVPRRKKTQRKKQPTMGKKDTTLMRVEIASQGGS